MKFRGYSGPGPGGDRFSYGQPGRGFRRRRCENWSHRDSVLTSSSSAIGSSTGSNSSTSSLKSPGHDLASCPSVSAAAEQRGDLEHLNELAHRARQLKKEARRTSLPDLHDSGFSRGRGGARSSATHCGEPLGADGYFLRPAPRHSAWTWNAQGARAAGRGPPPARSPPGAPCRAPGGA